MDSRPDWRFALLHNRRNELKELAQREAAGESFWTDNFDDPVRVKVWHFFRDVAGRSSGLYDYARELILRDEGLEWLAAPQLPATEDFVAYLKECDDVMFPTVVEAMSQSLSNPRLQVATGMVNPDAYFDSNVNTVLREHRVSYELVDHRMIEFSSRELHQTVVVPTLQLLAGRPDLRTTESAYQDALEEISGGKAADAITDAGTALQQALTTLGCTGNSLGPLIKSAKSKGLFAPHDSPMVEMIEKTLQWVSADRSESGDAHVVREPTVDDAWLIVHIVGALLLRLSKPSDRGSLRKS